MQSVQGPCACVFEDFGAQLLLTLDLGCIVDAGGSNYACVSVDKHTQTHHSDCGAAALSQT